MPALDDILTQRLHTLEEKHLRRTLASTQPEGGIGIERDGKKLINFSGNDYLGLSVHPDVVAAGQEALRIYGAGAGAARLVTGNHPYYVSLEQRLATIKHTQAALVIGSGYLANIGVIAALMSKDDLIVADKLVHACMLDGARLSGAKLMRFAHNDVADAQRILENHRGAYRHCMVMTETVFSMDGDVAPLGALSELAQQHDAWFYTDDAHGLGVHGGVSYASHHIQVGTLSKAAGAYGGYVCGSQVLRDFLVSSARSFIFSTALPPAVVASADKALEIMMHNTLLGATVLERARHFTRRLGMADAQSAIVPLIIGDADAAVNISKQLQGEGFFVSAIRPPTVPHGTARLRVTFSALHTADMVDALAIAVRQHIK
jgi:8-amino-7-oxononanoate synthase